MLRHLTIFIKILPKDGASQNLMSMICPESKYKASSCKYKSRAQQRSLSVYVLGRLCRFAESQEGNGKYEEKSIEQEKELKTKTRDRT